MLKRLFIFSLLVLSLNAHAANPVVKITTNKGVIELQLNREKAPLSVENFLAYAKSGFYSGTVFHRVIKDFMIQGGGFTTELERKETQPPIANEAFNGLKNNRGTIAMARTNMPHSATSQFFINTKDNDFLNFSGKNMRGWGYAVFGKVSKGMNVVDAIENLRTGGKGVFSQDVPLDTVIIQSVDIISE